MANASLYELSKRKNRSKLLKSAFVTPGHVNVEAYDDFYLDAAATPSGFDRVSDTIIAEVKRSFDLIDSQNEGMVYVTFYSSPSPYVIETAVHNVPRRGLLTTAEMLGV
jgi:hypothetical protein